MYFSTLYDHLFLFRILLWRAESHSMENNVVHIELYAKL